MNTPSPNSAAPAAQITLLASKLAAAMQMHGIDWDGRDLTGWVITEKMDGCRAYWDGETLYTKSGNVIDAPHITSELPKGMHLDGEIWAGRGKFETARRFVQYGQLAHDVFFVCFDAPMAPGGKAQRIEVARQAGVLCAVYTIAPSMGWLQEELARKIKFGAEGLMACDPDAPYATGRCDTLLKLKSHSLELFDAPATLPDQGTITLPAPAAYTHHDYWDCGEHRVMRSHNNRNGEAITLQTPHIPSKYEHPGIWYGNETRIDATGHVWSSLLTHEYVQDDFGTLTPITGRQ